MDMPKDSVILLSVINTRLRDIYGNLDALCDDLEWDREEAEKKLKEISYTYDEARNQFV